MITKQRLKLLAYNFIYAVLAILAVPVILVVVFMFIWDIPSCREDSEAVAYARSLSSERLAKLYRDMEMFSHKEDIPIDGYYVRDKETEVPPEFADLKVVKVRPTEGNIMVEGCFDHYIYLTFKGIGRLAKSDTRKEIILNWGEHPPDVGTEVLWSSE